MTQQSDAERLEEIASVDRPRFFLTLSCDEYDFLIALASRAVEAEAAWECTCLSGPNSCTARIHYGQTTA